MVFRSPFPDVEIPNLSLTEYIVQKTQPHLAKPALIDGPSGRTLTYAQLVGAIERMAAGLAARGFQQGDVFAIYSPNLPEYAIAFFGVAAVGGIVTTTNPLYTAEELAFQLRDAKARYLLTIPPFMEKALAAAKMSGVEEIFVFGEAEGATPFASLLQNTAMPPKVSINPAEDVVVLPYSSGTTGLPKGVMLTHRNLIANLVQLSEGFAGDVKLKSDDVVLGLLPFFHIYGMVVIMGSGLAHGATVVSIPRFEMEPFLQIMQKYGVSYANLVPPLVLALAKHPLVSQYDLSKLRLIFSGAAPLGGEVEKACQERLGCYVIQGYGMTEASPVVCAQPLPEGLEKPGSVGVCLPNTEVKFVNVATGEELGPNQQGELWTRGPQVMKGYLNNPAATAKTLDPEGWLHTGDIGYGDPEGYFYIIDRVKELIKYKGMQVAPAELEAILQSHPAVADAAVIGRPDPEAGEVPKAFVALKGQVSPEELMVFVAERVAPHKKVRFVEFMEALPRSASGKLLRRVLLEQERAKIQG